MKISRMKITLAQDDGWWIAEAEGVPGAYSQGRTVSSALNNLANAIRHLEKTYELTGRKPLLPWVR